MAAAVLKRAQLGLQQLVGAAATAARSAASGRIGGRATGGAAATQAPAITALDGAAFPGTRETFAWSPDALQDAGAGRQLLDLDASSWKRTRFVFLGCPGVGKGTYASRVARLLDVPHIAMGDLVRAEFKGRTAIGQKVGGLMQAGKLVPDDLVLEMLAQRLAAGAHRGEAGFVLDGFPRNAAQAVALQEITPVDLALNLRLRRDVIVAKCLGRRTCAECGAGFNVTDIDESARDGLPPMVMPPLPPPPQCAHKMTRRVDDTEEVIRARLEVYEMESKPVEDFFRAKGLLLDFDVLGGIPETWPRLLESMQLEDNVVLPEPLPRAA